MRSLPSEAERGRKGTSDQGRTAPTSPLRSVRADVHLESARPALLLGRLQAAALAKGAPGRLAPDGMMIP
jgi:hypothetical protein